MSDTTRVIVNISKENKADTYKQRQAHIDRQKEMGFVNPDTGAFMGLKADGEMTSGIDGLNQNKKNKYANFDVTPEKTEVMNRKTVITDDFLLNHQKFNMQLLALSDTKQLFESQSIGGLTLNGTVLVKVWEKALGRYVLMRRPIRTPLFGRVLQAPEIPDLLNFDIATVNTLDQNLANFIKLQRDESSKVTEDMATATGGSAYEQGDYNNYLDDFNSGSQGLSTSEQIDSPIGFSSPIRITEDFLALGSNRRTGRKIDMQGITIHSTGNPNSTARNERDWLENSDNNDPDRLNVAWHIAIDEKECIMAIPLDEYTVHAHTGNATTFGIEICESGNRQNVLERAATLVAQLLIQYHFSLDNLYRHADWGDKNCPRILNNDGKWSEWALFKEMIQEKIDNTLLVNANPNRSFYCWPCPAAKIVTAKLGDGRNHDGWDISEADAYNKNIAICTVADGVVEVANLYDKANGSWGGYGGCVIIDHGEGFKTLYGHMKNNSVTVKVGERVVQGQKIGIMGNTGNIIASAGGTGTHLHFSMYQYDTAGNRTVVDPEGKINSNS